MRVLFDLASVRVGGGVEQAISVLEEIFLIAKQQEIETAFVVSEGSAIHQLVRERGMRHVSAPVRLVPRIAFDLFSARLLLASFRPDCVYTFFGVGLPRDSHSKRIINVALPVLCYPDSAYWRFLPVKRRILARCKAAIRAFLIRNRSDLVLVETEIMKSRLVSFSGFVRSKLSVVPPVRGAVARLLSDELRGDRFDRVSPEKSPERCGVIFVSGVDPHKNLWRLVEVARILEEHSSLQGAVVFQLTVSQDAFVSLCCQMGVEWYDGRYCNYFSFLGPLHGEALADHIRRADIFANISDLESISNNYIEARAGEMTMLISNRDFALFSCRTPYVAVEPHDPWSVVRGLERIVAGVFEESTMKDQELVISAHERASIILS